MSLPGSRGVPLLDWVAQLAAVSTGAEVSVVVSHELSGPKAVAAFGVTLREAQGWLPVRTRWIVMDDVRSSPEGQLIRGGAFGAGFAAAVPVNRPAEGIIASLWVLSRTVRPSGLSLRERKCLDLLAGLALEPLVLHYESAGRRATGAGRVAVLIGDDEAAFRETVRAEFDAAGFAVEEAQSGRQVLRAINECQPDILVIDLAMPDGEGIETIRTLRAEGYSGVIVAMSGAFSPQMLRTAELLGANGGIAKPFRKGELSALVAKLLVDRWGHPGNS